MLTWREHTDPVHGLDPCTADPAELAAVSRLTDFAEVMIRGVRGSAKSVMIRG